MGESSFRDFFVQATGIKKGPYPYQIRLACEGETLPKLLDIPTGLGKTAAVVLAWLWRRRFAEERIREQTPRRLVYCLPMRVLVEQTYSAVQSWIDNLTKAGSLSNSIRAHLLMGGEEASDWDLYPEQDTVLIGTQDMLLSRALNRGYGMSRFRWPIHFGLLNNDCTWVFDEVQLMDSGVTTTAQLAGFREKLNVSLNTQNVWMSATLDPSWLNTVDFDPVSLGEPERLSENDRSIEEVAKRLGAAKTLSRAEVVIGETDEAADLIASNHQSGTRTLAVFNTVKRATEVYKGLRKRSPKADIVLIHSRFRQPDRDEKVQRLLENPPSGGIIAIATQVVEAGVDVSAKTLFTELAPWPSLVQRFGRCNRAGEFTKEDPANVHWFDLPDDAPERHAAPYQHPEMAEARELLATCADVSPATLERITATMRLNSPHVIRRRDFIDLFDTTPDLAGNDIDISRFIRAGEDFDVQLVWREWEQQSGKEPPPTDKYWRRIARKELCSAPVGEFRKFATNAKHRGKIWRWDALDGKWVQPEASVIYPGQTYVLHCDVGGYDLERGWIGGASKEKVQPLESEEPAVLSSDDAYDDDVLSALPEWQTLAEHTDYVVRELEAILSAVPLDDKTKSILKTAARWHDRGKAHQAFQASLPEGIPDPTRIWAKAPGTWKRYLRRHFRHELASALAMLASKMDNLAVYIVAAHHGKVRLSIRSLPGENPPDDDPNRLYARGIWDGDELPEADLGGGVVAPAVTLSLECMQLGRSAAGEPSWAERMLKLRDAPELGPFRLAYLEALLRAADMRASRLVAQPLANQPEAIP